MQQNSLIPEAHGKPANYGDSFTVEERTHAVREVCRWFELDTWPVREALLLLVGIDPYRADCWQLNAEGFSTDGHQPCWARITARPGIAVDDAGVPHLTGLVCDLFQVESLSQLLRVWVSKPGHTLQDRHVPSYYLKWAVDKGYGPFWRSWMSDADLLPERPSATAATASERARTDPLTTRQDNRLNLLREHGGEVFKKRGALGIKGIATLVNIEAVNKAPARTEKIIRKDLKAAYQRELDATRAGVFNGLGSR